MALLLGVRQKKIPDFYCCLSADNDEHCLAHNRETVAFG